MTVRTKFRPRRRSSPTPSCSWGGAMASEKDFGSDGRAGRSLASIRLLSSMSADALGQVENACRWRNYRAGESIIERGETTQDVYFLISGNARVLNLAVSGRFVAYALLGPGDFFGELAAIDGQPRSATVAAESPSRVAILPAREFRRLATSNQDIALSLLRRLTDIIRTCDDRIFDLSSLGAKQRIYFELLRLAEPDPSGAGDWVIFPLPTQTALAASADTTRQTVARTIGRLSEDGHVTRKSKALYIHDRKRLESLILQVKGEM